MDGFILLDKPSGITSLSACNKIKYKLKLNKCGHNGTLDPETTGVMLLGCDKATRLMKLVNEHDKEYIAEIIFGLDSDTLDMDGVITKDIEMNFTKNMLIEALDYVKGLDKQIPPMTSAIKINGKKLYEYQRENKEVTILPRDVKMYDYELLSFTKNDNHIIAKIRVSTSKGYYVRALARDLGIYLKGCAILKSLRRTKAGDFSIDKCKTLEEITENDIIPIKEFFKLPVVQVNDYIAKLVKNGVVLDERQTNLNEMFYISNNNEIIAMYEPVNGKYKPLLIF